MHRPRDAIEDAAWVLSVATITRMIRFTVLVHLCKGKLYIHLYSLKTIVSVGFKGGGGGRMHLKTCENFARKWTIFCIKIAKN